MSVTKKRSIENIHMGKLSQKSLCMHILPDSECLSLFHEDRSVPWRNAALNLTDESYFVFWY